MAVDFPASPTEGQTFLVNSITYTFRGGAWIIENAIQNELITQDVLAFDFGSEAPTANASLSVVVLHILSIPNNFVGSYSSMLVNPGSTIVIPISINGSLLGTLSLTSAGVALWEFTTPGSAFVMAAGSRVTMSMPATIPANFSGFSASILANRIV